MINRFLIRFKVLQVLYAYLMATPEMTLEQGKKELENSIAKTYELYNYLLRLVVELTGAQERRLQDAKNKYLPTPEELNPDTKFVDNELVELLRSNERLCDYVQQTGITWQDDAIFMKMMLDKVLQSDDYRDYMATPGRSLTTDCRLWRDLLKKVILPDELLIENLEEKSVFWSIEDIDLMGQFAIKTIKRFEEGDDDPLMPMYRNDEDRDFGEALFVRTACGLQATNELIDSYVRNDRWEPERIAVIDRLVMCMAVTELTGFESIPTTVTLNEYIELAKQFSTPNSGNFVNGILHTVLANLRQDGRVTKP